MDHWLANDNNVEGGGDCVNRAGNDNSTVPYDSESDAESLSVGEEEAHCDLDCMKMYGTEVKAYETLADLQGKYIPDLPPGKIWTKNKPDALANTSRSAVS